MSDKNLTYDGYIRVSRVNGRSGASYRSPEDQRAIIESLAEKHGLSLGEIVQEEDVSGGKTVEERELGRLVQKVRDGESGGLVVWNVKRYSRNWTDGIIVADEIFKAGGRLLSEDFQYDGKFARTILSFLLEIAEGELEERRGTWRRAVNGATARGVFIGTTPVGFDRQPDSTLRQNGDAPAVREVFLGRARGLSWNRLAAGLEAAGVKTATGKAGWHINSVRSLVAHPIYKGTIRNGIEHHFPEYAIITPSEWEAAQEKAPHVPRQNGKWALLGGLVFCAGCDHRMTPAREVRRGRVYSWYRCQNRTCRARCRADAVKLEGIVVEECLAEFARRVSEQGIGREADVQKVTELEQAVQDAEQELADFLAVARASDPGFEAAVEERRMAVENAKVSLTDEQKKQRRYPTPEEVRAVLDAGTLDEKRRAIRAVLAGVTVAKTGRRLREGVAISFDGNPDSDYEHTTDLAARIEVEWR